MQNYRRPEYRVWAHMRERCESPTSKDFPNYGGRGIVVATEWSTFDAFFRDMGERPSKEHTIERIDVNGPYAPWNCRWLHRSEQVNNRRVSVKVTRAGVTKTIGEWARELGIRMDTLWYRIRKLGWDPERALSEPSRPYRRRT